MQCWKAKFGIETAVFRQQAYMFALSAVTSIEIIATENETRMATTLIWTFTNSEKVDRMVSSLPMLNMSAPANAKSPKTTGIKYFTHIRFLD